MQALVDGHVFADAVAPAGVVETFVELYQRQRIGPVAVDFIGAGEAQRRFAAEIPRRHQHVERAHGVDVEIVVGDGGGLVVRRLRRGVDDEIGPLAFKELANAVAVANIDRRCL